MPICHGETIWAIELVSDSDKELATYLVTICYQMMHTAAMSAATWCGPQALHHYCANICSVARNREALACNNKNLLQELQATGLFLYFVPEKGSRLVV